MRPLMMQNEPIRSGIVVGVDRSPPSMAAVAWAALDQHSPGWDDRTVPKQEMLAEGLSDWRVRHPHVSIRPVAVSARPAPGLVIRSETAQLLAAGCSGRGKFAGISPGSFGGTAANAARIPVIVART
jgi:hypothetical protein